MPDDGEAVTLRVLERVGAVAAEAWDACAGPDDPFVGHAFLDALEDSQSAGPETGWRPQHLVLEGRDGALLGAVPLYLKSRSKASAQAQSKTYSP